MAEKCCRTCEHWTRENENSRRGNCYWPIPETPIWLEVNDQNGEDVTREDDGIACPVYSETSTPD